MVNKQPTKKINGLAVLVALFRSVDPVFRKSLLDKFTKVSPLFAKLVERHEFLFDELVRLDDRSLQNLIRSFPETIWWEALTPASAQLRETIYSNLSERVRNEWAKELALRVSTTPRIEAIKAQIAIAGQAHALLTSGTLKFRPKRQNLSKST